VRTGSRVDGDDAHGFAAHRGPGARAWKFRLDLQPQGGPVDADGVGAPGLRIDVLHQVVRPWVRVLE